MIFLGFDLGLEWVYPSWAWFVSHVPRWVWVKIQVHRTMTGSRSRSISLTCFAAWSCKTLFEFHYDTPIVLGARLDHFCGSNCRNGSLHPPPGAFTFAKSRKYRWSGFHFFCGFRTHYQIWSMRFLEDTTTRKMAKILGEVLKNVLLWLVQALGSSINFCYYRRMNSAFLPLEIKILHRKNS